MNIGVIGSGQVGAALGGGWAARGHSVMFSSREPNSDKMRALLGSINGGARAGTLEETVAFGEVVLVALPADAIGVLTAAGDWRDKIVIDAVNRFAPASQSVAESIAKMLPGASVVKAFNSIGYNIMANPHFGDQSADLLIAGDSANAKLVVATLAQELGFDAIIDAGPLANAALVEALAKLWVALARGGYGREIAFKLLTR